mmetsp:Transcript_17299/g.60459  ORF Transcript_17299/g.60459 Transcript_17299/m.60459 type:complete len:133 (+) Transcript_17299:471-869(+)
MVVEGGTETTHYDAIYDASDKLCHMSEHPVNMPVHKPNYSLYEIGDISDVLARSVEQNQVTPGEMDISGPTRMVSNPTIGKVFAMELQLQRETLVNHCANAGSSINGLDKQLKPYMMYRGATFLGIRSYTTA